ncbi:hypothetical protein [Shimia sp.]|uniref:hypothetical protein n=1 Tax=Shimia sp. TaxID=1954381 RepID=UPI0032982452
MAERKRSSRIDRIVASAEKVFGQSVEQVTAPGGEGRASFRVHLPDQLVIATLRPNFRRTHLEAFVLKELEGHCDLQPRCLGVDGEIMFQSDVGGRRLNQEIAAVDPGKKLDLAAESVTSILRIQAGARAAGLNEAVPHLGQNDLWVANFAKGPTMLAEYSNGRVMGLSQDDLCRAIDRPGQQFVKWDCRSGNAAIGQDEVLRWFDFEYCGARHGAEDLAWLIADEAWQVAPEDMQRIVTESFDPNCGHSLDDYLDYLALYVTFHCAQRLGLIVKEARKRGWLSKAKVRKYDDAGVHPEFAAQICRVGTFFGDRNSLTAPIARDFEEAEAVFIGILREGYLQAENLKEGLRA